MEQTDLHTIKEKPGKTRQNRLGLARLTKNDSLRMVIQAFVVVVMVYAAWRFYGFYQYVEGYGGDTTPYRPPVVEGFLPLAAIVAFKAMFLTWEIDPIHPAGLVIFIAILVTSWIFRRALCSWICPLGTLSEYLGKLGKRLMGRNLAIPKWLDILFVTLKYAIFLYILKTVLFLPASEAVSFMQIPYYTISDIKMFELFFNIGIKGLIFIVMMMGMSFLCKSFWCRYLCPYGALLGVIGILSPVVLKKDSDTCIKCDRCNNACPSKVNIKDKKHLVISTECTGCASCVSACPVPNTLEFKALGFLPIRPWVFAGGFIAVFFGIIILAMVTGHWQSSATLSDYQTIYRQMSGL